MTLATDLMKHMMEKFGGIIDVKEHPETLDDIVNEVAARIRGGGNIEQPSATPFRVSWMDSWVAHWVYHENLRSAETNDRALATVLRDLVDLKFRERLNEIQRYIRDLPPFATEAPDAGPPEPGSPPAGPRSFSSSEAPDAGPPEPGTPPAGPSRFSGSEPPDAGPPEPGTPPAGPSGLPGSFGENPWILYWFVSIKAPMLLEVIDLHLTRRLQELRRHTDV
jgi:hypothetical protein